jgi:hypothetical protein
MKTLKFIASALKYGRAYIDVDGTILKKYPVPDYVDADRKLKWWSDNLAPTPVIKRRLPLLYFLRALGVKLYAWTNRSPQHEGVTRKALGRHQGLFYRYQMYDGRKSASYTQGPIMDDQEKYITRRTMGDLLVKSL